MMGRRCYVILRRRYDVPIRLRGDAPLRRLRDVPSRRRWVFHLRRTCDVTGTYRETLLRRRHDVLMPGGKQLITFIMIKHKRRQVESNTFGGSYRNLSSFPLQPIPLSLTYYKHDLNYLILFQITRQYLPKNI